MPATHLGSIEMNETPPPLDLTPQESAALAVALVDYQAAVAACDDRKEQAPWG